MRVILPLAVLLMLVSGSAGALNLSDYVAEVVQTNPQVLQRTHVYRQLVEDRRVADKGWRPVVDLTASVGSYSTESPIFNSVRRNYSSDEAALTVTQNLFNGFDSTWQREQADARILSEVYRIYDVADNLSLEAINAYVYALKQRHLVALAKRSVDSHERILVKIRERYDSGVGRRSEVEQTEGRLAQAYASLYAANNNLQDGLTRVHFYLGRYVTEEELEEVDIPEPPQGDLEQLIDIALADHPALKSASFNIEARRADYQRSHNSRYPTLDLQFKKVIGDNVSGYDGSSDDHSLVLHMTYNLYNGGADSATRRQKLSAVHEEHQFSSTVRREAIEALRLAWMGNDALAGQYRYLQQYEERSQKTVDFYQEEFFIGQRDLLDLLDAENELNKAMIRRTEAQYDYLQTIFRLHEGVGSLFQALAVAVEMDQSHQLRLVSVDVKGVDGLPLNEDRDVDLKQDRRDHCDNTILPGSINQYGCITTVGAKFDYAPEPEAEPEPEPEQEPEPEPLKVGEVNIRHLTFVYDSDRLTEESVNELISVIRQLKGVPEEMEVEVTAHTDSQGSDAYNEELSQRRANHIKDILIGTGLAEARIVAKGKGEQEPIAENDTEEGRARNRRVEFFIRVIGPLPVAEAMDGTE